MSFILLGVLLGFVVCCATGGFLVCLLVGFRVALMLIGLSKCMFVTYSWLVLCGGCVWVDHVLCAFVWV